MINDKCEAAMRVCLIEQERWAKTKAREMLDRKRYEITFNRMVEAFREAFGMPKVIDGDADDKEVTL